MSDDDNLSIDRAVVQALQSLRDAGIQQVAKPSPEIHAAIGRAAATRGAEKETPADLAPAQSPESTLAKPLPAETASTSTAPTLEVLAAEVAACTLCEELATTRTQTVFGVGDPNARLCVLGEAPGADEDRLGEPFVGRGGQLLNKILEACSLRREDVYILNVLRCRPPGNRNPKEDEVHNCRQFLERQIQLVDPEFICCMGAVAAQNLLSTTTPIGRLRGEVHDYRGIKVVCTYHPAYLLRNPSAKKNTWEDMKMLMREMGTPVD
ncbi:MAG: uracil-DNA glycosylase [Planctomycetota bacterium]